MISINKLPRARVVFLGERGKRPLRGESAKTKESGMVLGTFFLSFSFLFFSFHARDVRDFIDRKYACRVSDVNSHETCIIIIREAEERTTDPFR